MDQAESNDLQVKCYVFYHRLTRKEKCVMEKEYYCYWSDVYVKCLSASLWKRMDDYCEPYNCRANK